MTQSIVGQNDTSFLNIPEFQDHKNGIAFHELKSKIENVSLARGGHAYHDVIIGKQHEINLNDDLQNCKKPSELVNYLTNLERTVKDLVIGYAGRKIPDKGVSKTHFQFQISKDPDQVIQDGDFTFRTRTPRSTARRPIVPVDDSNIDKTSTWATYAEFKIKYKDQAKAYWKSHCKIDLPGPETVKLLNVTIRKIQAEGWLLLTTVMKGSDFAKTVRNHQAKALAAGNMDAVKEVNVVKRLAEQLEPHGYEPAIAAWRTTPEGRKNDYKSFKQLVTDKYANMVRQGTVQ
eukprot:g4419.t1